MTVTNPLSGCTMVYNQSPVDDHLRCLQPLIIKNVAVNDLVHLPFCTHTDGSRPTT